jgi:hypothetical protein
MLKSKRKLKKKTFSQSNQTWPKEINAMNILRKLTFNCLLFFVNHPKRKLEGSYSDVSVFCRHMYNFEMELEEFCTFFFSCLLTCLSFFFFFFFAFLWPFFLQRRRERERREEEVVVTHTYIHSFIYFSCCASAYLPIIIIAIQDKGEEEEEEEKSVSIIIITLYPILSTQSN